MKYTKLTIFMFVILSFTGCDNSMKTALKKVDIELSNNVEKGEFALDSILCTPPKMNTFEKKYYQLLRLKADDKSYRSIMPQKAHVDSLLSYFQDAGDDDVLAEAYFYAGRVYYEIGDKPESLRFYQKANEKVAKKNYALQGDIYCQMANIYQYTDLYPEALEALFSAYRADSLNGNTRNMLYDIRNIGESYYGLKKYSHAESYFQKGLKLSESKKDTLMEREFHHKLATIDEQHKNWAKALYHVTQYFNHIEDFYDISGYTVTALEAFTQTGKDSLANKCIKLMLAKGNIFTKQNAIETQLQSRIKAKSDSSLLSQFQLYIQYTDSVIKESNADAIKRTEQSYNYELKEKENHYLRSQNLIKTIGILMTALIAILIFLYFYMKVKNIRQEQKILEFKLDKYKTLKDKSDQKAKSRLASEQSVICKSSIYQLLVQEISSESFNLSEENWGELSNIVNCTYREFNKNLYSFLKPTLQQYRICLLIKLGVPPINIAKFLNVSKEAITASRRRMYEKAFNKHGSPSDWDKIIKSL